MDRRRRVQVITLRPGQTAVFRCKNRTVVVRYRRHR
jgi:hypothetical protein